MYIEHYHHTHIVHNMRDMQERLVHLITLSFEAPWETGISNEQ